MTSISSNDVQGSEQRPPELPLTAPPGCPFAVDSKIAEWRATEPVKRISLADGKLAWLLSRYDDVRGTLNQPGVSASMKIPDFPASGSPGRRSNLLAETMLRKDGEEHARLRRLVTRVFMPKKVATMRPGLDAKADRLCDEYAAAGPGSDFYAIVAGPLTSEMINELLGVPASDVEEILRVINILVSISTPDEKIERELDKFESFWERLIEEKRENRGDDPFTDLIDRYDEGGMTFPELVSFIFLLVSAGYDTSANTITLSVLLLAHKPELLEQLKADPDLYPSAVDEFLRFTTVSRTGLRRALALDAEPRELHGKQLKPGEGVIPFLMAANRDPEMFPEPDEIDFTRPNVRQHMTFGHGPHQCLGQHLAREQMLAILPLMVERFRGLRLAIPFEELDFKDDSAVYGAYSLPLEWDDYVK